MLTLTAKTVHLNGEHSKVEGTFGPNGGSIGRGAQCDMVLPDPDRRISRIQAHILHTDGQYVLSNASTSNPMYINGVELTPGSSQTIRDGDELRAGSYMVKVSHAAHTSVPAPPQNGEYEAAAVPAPAAPPATTSPEPGFVLAEVDPLLALGPRADAGGVTGADPFADLLAKAAPIDSVTPAGRDAAGMETPPTPAARHDPPEPVQLPAPPLTERKPPDTLQAIEEPRTTQDAKPPLPPAKSLDPNAPFGDLLAQALPVGAGEIASVSTSPAVPPSSRQDMGAGFDEPRSGHDSWNSLEPASPAVPPPAGSALENPFELPAAPAAPSPRAGGEDSALSRLAGDPFADLMGPPIEKHLANAPVPERMADIIPEDFNPLAAGGVAQRNSSDPLTPIGLHAGGLTDVLPETTIDSIYNPGAESPTTLVVDPLEKTQERVLSVEQSMDPLKLFAGDDSGLIPGDPEIGAVGSASNHAPEMTAYFRAPVPKVDPGMLAGEAAKAGAAPPAPVPLDSPAAADTPPPDVWADPAPAMMAAHPADGTETDAPLPPPPAADVSGADHAAQENEPGLDSTQADDVAPPDPGQPATEWPSAVTAPPTEPPSVHAGQSGAQDAEALKAAFKRGAGLDEWSAAAVTPELMETVGQLLQTAAQGAVSLLAARAAIKQEIHLSVTLINPKLNNPLKFLPDGHTALLQMLGPKMPGFMAPLAAMQEAFDDLLRHQAAIAAGTQAMIEALFHRFDPDSIESRHPKNGMGEKLSQTVHHARLWNLYTSQYRLIKEEIKDDFFKRLGAEFHDAYNREYGSHAGDDE